MSDVTVVTSIYGNIDTLKAHPDQTVPCEWVAVVDQPLPTDGPWRQVVEPRPYLHPRMAAKYAKLYPGRYTDSPVTIWIDGGGIITSPDFVAMCLDALGDKARAQWEHPDRDCIYTEAAVLPGFAKYHGQNYEAQVAHYRSLGHPDHWGLWATGCIVRSDHNGRIEDRWLSEMVRWSVQDQLSYPFVLRSHGERPASLPQSLWRNPWIRWTGH